MESALLGLVIFLFVLAVSDLVVGVSNDAVNFMNSAIGSKVATFKTIMIVAACGILIGATTSNGMMDIARNGIFNPSQFGTMELMTIFLAVMITDVVVLDMFNTMGMPTSTTVSMVFELLGGSFALAMIKISGDPSLSLGSLLNTDKALEVITGIFVSVPIAFVMGCLVQWLTRVIFTFTFKDNLKWKVGPFGGMAAACIIYFMLVKGMKNLTFMSPAVTGFVSGHSWVIFLGCLVVFTIITYLLNFLKVNVFRILVLMGTFALAMAFAGNDLVNFIGVPMAGYSVYLGEDLTTSAKTPFIFLLLAGIIMVIALATSKKAHNVTKTEVGLGKQDESDEMFGSSKAARVLVRACRNAALTIDGIVPVGWRRWISSRFNVSEAQYERGAAFDELRATVNLVVASLLIALGTSLKLPLSTTYVTFMVAMGSSLADKAWSRESAVYRVTGVLSVIGGWFITAGIAFVIAFICANLMYIGGYVMIGILMALALYLLVRSNVRFNRKQAEGPDDKVFEEMMETRDKDEVYRLLGEHIKSSQGDFLDFATESYQKITDGFMTENVRTLDKVEDAMRKKRGEIKSARRKEMLGLRRIDTQLALEKGTWFHVGRNACENILYCLRRICNQCQEHVDNNFTPLEQEKAKAFTPLRDTLLFLLKRASNLMAQGDYANEEKLIEDCRTLEERLKDARHAEMISVQSTKENITLSYVYMNLLQESQEVVDQIKSLIRAAKRFNRSQAVSAQEAAEATDVPASVATA